jgi:hypothetical protein
MEARDEYKAKEETSTSRRHILASIAGMIASGRSGVKRDKRGKNISAYPHIDTRDMTSQTSLPFNNTIPLSQKRSAFVALPGIASGPFLANLPYILNYTPRTPPIIFMDRYDYDRIWGWALKKNSSQWIQNLAMGYSLLTQQDIIRPINYSDFYEQSDQQRNLTQGRTILKAVSDEDHIQAAKAGADGWLGFSRGDYQGTFRVQLGEKPGAFSDARRLDEKRKRKLKRGVGNPNAWNERVFAQYAAALEVCSAANEQFNHLNVNRIIGQGESGVVRKILDAKGVQHSNALDSFVLKPDPDDLAPTREALDEIGEIATEIANKNHSDWVFLAPTLAVPQSPDLFKMRRIKSQLHYGLGVETLTEQGTYVKDVLKRRTEHPARNKLDEIVEWIAESENVPGTPSQAQKEDLLKITSHAVNLEQYAPELDRLIERDGISQAGALVGYSALCDPSARDDEDYVHQQCERLINHFHSSSVGEAQLMAFRRRKKDWDNNPDWYLNSNRRR